MIRIIFLCLVTVAWDVAGQCSFPFNGTWVSSSDGTWTVNNSHLLGFKVTGISGVSTLSFKCFETQGNLYTLQSTYTVEIFNGVFKTLYTCLDIRFSTSVKYVYYKNTDTGSPTANEMTIQSDFNNICNKASYDEPYYHHVALLSGSETTALENCPESLFGSFTYNTCTDPGSNSTSMNVCDTRQQLIYNYTLCNTEQMFSADGVLDCVYFVESGTVTYLTVYNRDSTTPDEVSYFRFSCLAIEESGSTRMITANPEQCVVNQDPATIPTPGQAIQFEPYYLCLITTTVSTTSTTVSSTTVTHSTTEAIVNETSETSANIGLIIGIVAAIIVLAIIAALIILCCCLRKRRQRKKVDEEQAIAEDTDDQRSQRSEHRRDSGSSSQDEDKRSIDSGIGREPLSGRATRSDYKRLDDQEQEEEVAKTVGELDVDDKSSRPRSGQEIPYNYEIYSGGTVFVRLFTRVIPRQRTRQKTTNAVRFGDVIGLPKDNSRESASCMMAAELKDGMEADNENVESNVSEKGTREGSVLKVTGKDANSDTFSSEDKGNLENETVNSLKDETASVENLSQRPQDEKVREETNGEQERIENTVRNQDYNDTEHDEDTYLNQETANSKTDERFAENETAKCMEQSIEEANANKCDGILAPANSNLDNSMKEDDKHPAEDKSSSNLGSLLSGEDTKQDGQFDRTEEFSGFENKKDANKETTNQTREHKTKDRDNSASQTLQEESSHRRIVQFSQDHDTGSAFENASSIGNTNTDRNQSVEGEKQEIRNEGVFSEREAEPGGQNFRIAVYNSNAIENNIEREREIRKENSQMNAQYAKQDVSSTDDVKIKENRKDVGDRNADKQDEIDTARDIEQSNKEFSTDTLGKKEDPGTHVQLLGEKESEEDNSDGEGSKTDKTDKTDKVTDREQAKANDLYTEMEKGENEQSDAVPLPKEQENDVENIDGERNKTNKDDKSETTTKDIDSKRKMDSRGAEEDVENTDNEKALTTNATIIYVGQGTEDRHGEDIVDSKTDDNKEQEAEQENDKTSTDGQQSDNEERTKKKKRKVRNVIGITSDVEEIYDTGSEEDQSADDDDSSLDDAERERRRIGGKKGHMFTPAGPLTTVLVSRHDEERRRNKQRSKSKKQKMRGLAKKRTKVHGVDKQPRNEEDLYSSEEDESRRHGTRDAPFIEQYRYKKRIENKLDEEHYWTDPTADEDPLRRNEDIDSLFGSKTSTVGSDYEDEDTENEVVVGPDGVLTKVKKSPKNKHTKLHGSIADDTEGSKPRDVTIYKVTAEGKTNDSRGVKDKDIHIENSQEDVIDKDDGVLKEENNQDSRDSGKSLPDSVVNDDARNTKYTQDGRNKKVKQGGTHLIHVKEHQENRDYLQKAEMKTNPTKQNESKSNGNKLNDKTYALDCSYHEKASDTDSGVEDEEILDVVLTSEQQQMVVNVLFDENMRLRPEFEKDENERIVRKLDNTVIYDPHTGRFTFRRQLGRLFNVPRLRRNKKGRPTGGYIEDDYGPKKLERQKSGRSRCSHRDSESRLSLSDSPIYDKRSRGDIRNVGFSVPDDDDMESISVGDLEFHKRGRRDLGSGIRRKLKNRLFRNRRKRAYGSAKSQLPAVHLKRAWTSDTVSSFSDVDGTGPGDLSPVIYRGGRPGYSTPGSQQKGGTNPQQRQKYREGLESDRRILAGLQDKSPVGGRRDRGLSCGAFAELDEESSSDPVFNEFSENEDTSYGNRPEFSRGPTYWSEDGRLIVRERGCPELPPPPLFSIIRRPGTITREEQSRGNNTNRQQTAPKSAPVPIQNHNDHSPRVAGENESGSSEGLSSRTMGDSQLSFIDDNRLRRLLEELYRDKKYFDRYVETTEPQSELVIHTKGLAEHGRGYLLDRADYWEKRGPLPSRPAPQTEIGWKMYRQQTLLDSARTSEHDSTMTVSPEIRPYTVPGYVDSSSKTDLRSPRDVMDNNQNRNETVV